MKKQAAGPTTEAPAHEASTAASSPKRSLVAIVDGEARTSTLTIAEGAEVQHKNVIALVRTYLADLKEFGRVAFKSRAFETAGGVQKQEYANLNQEQATLIMTYMKNSEVVRNFKKQLVKEFFETAKQLSAKQSAAQEKLFDFVAPHYEASALRPAPIMCTKGCMEFKFFGKPIEAAKVFMEYLALGKGSGLEGNQAVLAANVATKALTGFDPLALLGATHLRHGMANIHYTPTELGARCSMTGREFNIALEAAGLQTQHGKQWMPTVKGRPYAVLLDVHKRKGDTTPIQQLKWTADVLDVMPKLQGGAQ